MLVRTVEGLAAGILQDGIPQTATDALQSEPSLEQSATLKHTPKIFTETGKIDWHKPVYEVHNLIRGLSPYPAAFTYLQDRMLKIYSSKKEITIPTIPVGTADTNGKTYLKFACPDGYIHVLELQLEGKKRMPVEEFLRGFRF